MKRFWLVLTMLTFAATVLPQEPTVPPIPNPGHANMPLLSPAPKTSAPAKASLTATFDPAAATREWLNSIPADQKAKSNAYFEGGYWLILWNFLVNALIALLLLVTRVSARIRDFAGRKRRYGGLNS